MRAFIEVIERKHLGYEQQFNFMYRDQFHPMKFNLILQAYTMFLPLVFEKLRLVPDVTRLVARGMSGTVFVLPLAVKLGCQVTIVRKDDENSHGQKLEGVTDLTLPWIFIDDCIDTGATFRVCERAMGKPPACKVLWSSSWRGDENETSFELGNHIEVEDSDRAC